MLQFSQKTRLCGSGRLRVNESQEELMQQLAGSVMPPLCAHTRSS